MNKEKMFSVNYDQINKIYVAVNDQNELTKIYVEINDENGKSYVQAKSYDEMGLNHADFQHEVNRWFSALAKEKGSMLAKDSDYVVARENVVLFASLDRRIKTQKERGEYKFDVDNSNNIVAEENTTNDFDSKIPEDLAIANMRTADDEAFENKEYSINEKTKINSKKIALSAAIIGLTAAIGAGTIGFGLSRNKKDEDVVLAEEPAITTEVDTNATTIEVAEKISLEGQDWDYYFNNANASTQKDTMAKINDFVMNFNRSEDWMYEKMTPEMIEALKEANIIVDGDEAIFGFTPEQVFALRLVYGHDTYEELTTMMNGEYIDVTKVMSSSESLMNQGIRAEIEYLLNSDQTRSGIEEVIGFTDEEKAQINPFLDSLQIYKELLKEEKYEEAEKKMKDIKEALVKYAHEPDVEAGNAKPWVLRTILPVSSIYSVSYQYMDTINLNLYDGKTGEYVDKEVKTWLFDEITMRDLVEGYKECVGEDGLVYQDGFDSVEFLKQFNISTQRYSIVVSDDGVSIADQYIGGLENRLEEANDYMQKLREENSAADTLVLDSNPTANVSQNTELDEMTKDSFDSEEVLDLIEDNLVKENKYPKNLQFFTSIYSKFSKQVLAFKDAIAAKLRTSTKTTKKNEQVVKTIPGRTIYVPGTTQTVTWTETWTEDTVTYRTEKRANENYEAEKEAAEKEAVEEASKTTVTDGETGKEKETTYQDIYNKAVNDKTDGKTDLDTNLDDNDKTNQNDPLVNKVEQWAEEDAKQIKEEHEKAAENAKEEYVDENGNHHYISGGDEKIDEQYQNADIVSESEAEEYNRKLQEQKAQQSNSTNSASTPAPTPAPAPVEEPTAGQGEYTTEDPTTSDTFAPALDDSASIGTSMMRSAAPMMTASLASEPEPAPEAEPVVEETTAGQGEYTTEDPTVSDTFAPAYEEEIDSIIESLAQEAPAEEASEGMSK